jgi:hypothetical protein
MNDRTAESQGGRDRIKLKAVLANTKNQSTFGQSAQLHLVHPADHFQARDD